MKKEFFFGNALWVGAAERTAKTFSVLRGTFFVGAGAKRATLRVLGLGFFKCYINGVCINPDSFLPLSSDFEGGCEPSGEIFAAHRVYVPEFDISEQVRAGENVIAIHYGGGWYTAEERCFGLPKVIYHVSVEEAEGSVRTFGSSEKDRVAPSYVDGYVFTSREEHDYTRAAAACFEAKFDDGAWEHAVPTEELETEYCSTDCPRDALAMTRAVEKLGAGDGGATVYDCGENTTGYPLLEIEEGAPAGARISVTFSEELTAEGKLDLSHAHGQRYTVVADGKRRTVQPEFTWFGFRYFEVEGPAAPLCVKVVHAAVPVASSFDCDNETLNWIYKTFVHTMLCNMHTGHPSDCPHIERRGYTGDGQLTCHAALTTLGARSFYEKWARDIADGQDTVSGHVQYTAPYIRSGGGPGGWGCAIVEVPYQLYRHFGDAMVLAEHYDGMRRYIDYLEAHSEFGLVTSDRAGEWCLGDWCGPNILYPEKDITSHNQQILLPAPFVNTYFMVKALRRMAEIAAIIGRDGDIAEYEEKARLRAAAMRAAYFNAFDANFIMNAQGANSFAVDIGIGSEKTLENLVSYYEKLGHFDTGIFATDVLCRVLFERGFAELAVELLTNDGEQGFEHWRKNGATTFHEYWDSARSRSHDHQMFGAPVAYFFEYLLGIKQKRGTAGYAELSVEPQLVTSIARMSGSMQGAHGEIAVAYEKGDDAVHFEIFIPHGVTADFKLGAEERRLVEGKNEFSVAL